MNREDKLAGMLQLPPLWAGLKIVPRTGGRPYGKTLIQIAMIRIYLESGQKTLLCTPVLKPVFSTRFKVHGLGDHKWMVEEEYPADYAEYLREEGD